MFSGTKLKKTLLPSSFPFQEELYRSINVIYQRLLTGRTWVRSLFLRLLVGATCLDSVCPAGFLELDLCDVFFLDMLHQRKKAQSRYCLFLVVNCIES